MRNLLAIEDDPLLRALMAPTLASMGYDVTSAVDCREALEALRGSTHFALMLLDIMLPLAGAFDDGHEGLEAGLEILRRVREDDELQHRRDVPVVVYSVRVGEPRIRARVEQLGGVIVPKGTDPQRLLDTMRELAPEEGG